MKINNLTRIKLVRPPKRDTRESRCSYSSFFPREPRASFHPPEDNLQSTIRLPDPIRDMTNLLLTNRVADQKLGYKYRVGKNQQNRNIIYLQYTIGDSPEAFQDVAAMPFYSPPPPQQQARTTFLWKTYTACPKVQFPGMRHHLMNYSVHGGRKPTLRRTDHGLQKPVNHSFLNKIEPHR